ncbi:hypothetical protein L7F22_048190, partial [Adiantum nelumboides]
NGKK